MRKFFWFGDSWLQGSELELTVPPGDILNFVFPTLVSNAFSAKCVNKSESGSGPDIIPHAFSKASNQMSPGDIAFFFLSAPHRVSLLSEQGIPHQIIPGPNYNRYVHPYVNQWFKFFDTEPQRIYTYERTINLLYLWCKELGVIPYFCNIFTTVETSVITDLTPSSAWILPKNQCLAQIILHSIDNKNGVVISDDIPEIKTDDWNIHKEMLELYVKPGYCHPNVQGHKKISEKLIDFLSQNVL